MEIDEKTVTKIAKLARLRVEDSEKAHYVKELSTIFKWIEQLQEVDTENVPIMTSVVDSALPKRVDEVTDGGYQEDVTANAPISEFNCFVVPKVVDQG